MTSFLLGISLVFTSISFLVLSISFLDCLVFPLFDKGTEQRLRSPITLSTSERGASAEECRGYLILSLDMSDEEKNTAVLFRVCVCVCVCACVCVRVCVCVRSPTLQTNKTKQNKKQDLCST
jgi:hypothetical protein